MPGGTQKNSVTRFNTFLDGSHKRLLLFSKMLHMLKSSTLEWNTAKAQAVEAALGKEGVEAAESGSHWKL